MEPKLQNKSDFSRLLRDYKPSDSVLDLFAKLNGVFLVAPAGSGRNTVINNLIMTDKYFFIVSDTTRPPRLNNGKMEEDGVAYWFKTEQQVLSGLERGEYLAPALIHSQQVSGIHLFELKRAIDSDKICITDMDINGYLSVASFQSKMRALFILPPDFDIWMERLKTRGAISEKEFSSRLYSAIDELSTALEFKMPMIVNNDIYSTTEAIHQFAENGTVSQENDTVAQNHANDLIEKLKYAQI